MDSPYAKQHEAASDGTPAAAQNRPATSEPRSRLRLIMLATATAVMVLVAIVAWSIPRRPTVIAFSYARGSLAQFTAFEPMTCYAIVQVVLEFETGLFGGSAGGSRRLEFIHRRPGDGSCDAADLAPFDRVTEFGTTEREAWLDYFLIDEHTTTESMAFDPTWDPNTFDLKAFADSHDVADWTPDAFRSWKEGISKESPP